MPALSKLNHAGNNNYAIRLAILVINQKDNFLEQSLKMSTSTSGPPTSMANQEDVSAG